MSSAGWCKVLSIYRLRCSLGHSFPARRAQELLLGPIQRPCLEAVATPRVASRRPSQVLVRCHFGPSALSSPRISSTCPCAALLPPRPSNPRTAQVVRGALQAIDAPRLPPSSESSRPAGIAGRPLCKLNPRGAPQSAASGDPSNTSSPRRGCWGGRRCAISLAREPRKPRPSAA